MAWIAPSIGHDQSPKFAIAMADGLSSSRGAEWAAPVVCYKALQYLVTQSGSDKKPTELAERAFHSAGKSLTEMVLSMEEDVVASCPIGEFSRTWQHILSKGLLLQTTLSVIWCDGEFFYSAVVGDGGILLRPTDDRNGDREIAKCDLSTSLVHPLGPGMSDNELARQDFTKTAVGHMFRGLICTDGIARGVDNDLSALLDKFSMPADVEADNSTSLFIDEAKRTDPQLFDDNLSLAVFHVTQERSP
jgi:serine/threonine protein phosphatase PrpC